MQEHQLLIDGIRTPCLDSGGDRREAVLFLHGNPGCGADWLPLANEVAQFAEEAKQLLRDQPDLSYFQSQTLLKQFSDF